MEQETNVFKKTHIKSNLFYCVFTKLKLIQVFQHKTKKLIE